MGVVGINHVTVLVKDKAISEEFYTRVLGLESYPVGKSLWLKVGNQFLHITTNSGKSVNGSFYHFALEVDRFHDYIYGLIQKGTEVFDLDRGLRKIKVNTELDDKTRQFFVYDPDGNLVELIDTDNQFFKKGLNY